MSKNQNSSLSPKTYNSIYIILLYTLYILNVNSHRSLIFHCCCVCDCKNEEGTSTTTLPWRWITCSVLYEVETSRRYITCII